MNLTWDDIQDWASQVGIDAVGVAPAGSAPGWERFQDWLSAGYAEGMPYLAREEAVLRRQDPRRILPEARSVLMVGVSVGAGSSPPLPALHGRVARFAWNGDYHSRLLERLELLVGRVAHVAGDTVAHRCYVDTGPVLERGWAALAGLGYIGRSGCLIHPRLGSHLLLGVALLGADLPSGPGKRMPTCGTCTRCVEACPTQAIVAPGVVDARRCLAYLTIEHRGPIPEALRSRLGTWVFGCDRCQEVCPWNRKPEGSEQGSVGPLTATLALLELLALDEDGLRARLRQTALRRAKAEGLARNAAVVLGNLGDASARGCLEEAAAGHWSMMVREHAVWALERLP